MWVKCHECKGTGFEPHQTTIIKKDGTYKYKKICQRCNIFCIDRIDNFLLFKKYLFNIYLGMQLE